MNLSYSCSAVVITLAGASLRAWARTPLPRAPDGEARSPPEHSLSECAALEPTPTSLSTRPPALPGYDFLDKIGEGGAGEVFRARQVSLNRVVAVKLLPLPEGVAALGAPVSGRWLREPRLMAVLNHPNVVSVFDCVRGDGGHYLVMEYVDGVTLRELMRPGVPCSSRNPRLARGADSVLAAALERDPELRPATVEEFRRALNDALGRRRRGAFSLLPALKQIAAWAARAFAPVAPAEEPPAPGSPVTPSGRP